VNRLQTGLLAGAVGTLALNAATYADMGLRGRPPSTVPEDTVRRSAQRLGIDALDGPDRTALHRRQGVAALSGYATGITVGAVLALLRPARPLPALTEALAVGGAAMVAGNAGAVAAGTTDPRRWTFADLLADVVPHLAFGLAAVATWRAVAGQGRI
jgi:hypothetical protein